MYIFKFVVLFLAAIFIIGCASKDSKDSKDAAVFSYGELCSKKISECLITELERNGARIFYLGDHIKLEMPLDKVFYNNGTSNTLIDHPQILDTVASLLQCYQKISVRIQINTGSDDALSRMRRMEQGEAVLHYLNTKAIDARWVYLSGADVDSFPGYPTLVVVTRKLP